MRELDKSKIRYAIKEDKAFFKEKLFVDQEAREKLNVHGSDEESLIVISDGWKTTFVYDDDGPKGFVTVTYHSNGNKAYLADVYIIPEARREGIAKFLILFAMEYAKIEWSPWSMYALTLENKNMAELLTSIGFRNSGTYKDFAYRDGHTINQTCWVYGDYDYYS